MRIVSEKAFVAGSAFILFALPLALMFQGLDFTDTGWVLSNYQNFFSAPESVSYWFHLWFTNLVGGSWNAVFGAGGLLSFRFAGVLIFWLTAFLVFLVYRDTVKPRHLFPALLMGMVFHFPSKITTIHYNNVSALLLVLGAFLLLGWVRSGNPVGLAASGAAFCLAAFARFPNLLAVLFVTVVVLADFLRGKTLRAAARDLAVFSGGFAAAALLTLLAMKALGHLDLYFVSIRELFSGSKEELSHYGSNTIEKKFFVDHGRAVAAALAGLACLGLYRAALGRLGGRRAVAAGLVVLAAAAAAVSWTHLWSEAMPVVYFMTGLVYLTALVVLLLPDTDGGFTKCGAACAVILLTVLSVGSDTGMKVGAYGLLFGLPLAAKFWIEGPDVRAIFRIEGPAASADRSFASTLEGRRGVFILIVALYAAFSLPFLYRGSYRDWALRRNMTHTVDHPLLRGVFTTEDRARVVTEALRALETYVEPGDELIAFESIPMIHYLTRTRPYLRNSWPILYLPSEFERNLKKASAAGGKLPPAILAKIQTRNGNWPKSGGVSSTETAIKDRAMLEEFFRERGYRQVWENEAFRILVPR